MSPVLKIVLVYGSLITLLAMLLHGVLRFPFVGMPFHITGILTTIFLIVFFLFTFMARWSWGLPILTCVPHADKVIFLTFDDGPSSNTTPLILDILREYHAHATFFVLGDCVQSEPKMARRIVDEGHTIGIHSFQHRELVLASPREVRRQITETKLALLDAGIPTDQIHWFRPPYGFKTLLMPWIAHRLNCKMVTWSLDSRDYHFTEPKKIAENVLSNTCPGTIVLLHDGSGNAETGTALRLILEGLRAKDYQCLALNDVVT